MEQKTDNTANRAEGGLILLAQIRLDCPGKTCPGPVKPAFHGADTAVQDFGDFLVAFALAFAEGENQPVMFGKLLHGFAIRFLIEISQTIS